MNLFQIVAGILGFLILLFAYDGYKRKKLNLLHFIVFFFGTSLIIIFLIDIDLLNKFGRIFGIERGADLLVYTSIIFLAYLYFQLLNGLTKQNIFMSKLISNISIENLNKEILINSTLINQNELDKFVILIRCFNEGTIIKQTIEKILKYGFRKIIILNDGSKDDSKQIIEKIILENQNKQIILLNHIVNRGGGAANKTLFSFISKYYNQLEINRCVTFDADGQMDINDMNLFIKSIKENPGVNIFLGSRFIKGGVAKNISLIRKLILFGSRIITFIFNKIYVSDPHNGYRVLNISVLKNINISSDGMTYASELLEELGKQNQKIVQVPVNILYTKYSMGKGQKNSNAINILIELIYKKYFYR